MHPLVKGSNYSEISKCLRLKTINDASIFNFLGIVKKEKYAEGV